MFVLEARQGKKKARYESPNKNISPDKIVEFVKILDMPSDRKLTELRFESLKRSIKLRRELLQQCISSRKVQEIYSDQTRQSINQKTNKGDLLAIRDKGRWWYPLWQFDANGPNRMVAGLGKVSRAIHGTPLEKILWLSSENSVFEGQRPIDVLKSGEMDRVLAEAAGVGAAAF